MNKIYVFCWYYLNFAKKLREQQISLKNFGQKSGGQNLEFVVVVADVAADVVVVVAVVVVVVVVCEI